MRKAIGARRGRAEGSFRPRGTMTSLLVGIAISKRSRNREREKDGERRERERKVSLRLARIPRVKRDSPRNRTNAFQPLRHRYYLKPRFISLQVYEWMNRGENPIHRIDCSLLKLHSIIIITINRSIRNVKREREKIYYSKVITEGKVEWIQTKNLLSMYS